MFEWDPTRGGFIGGTSPPQTGTGTVGTWFEGLEGGLQTFLDENPPTDQDRLGLDPRLDAGLNLAEDQNQTFLDTQQMWIEDARNNINQNFSTDSNWFQSGMNNISNLTNQAVRDNLSQTSAAIGGRGLRGSASQALNNSAMTDALVRGGDAQSKLHGTLGQIRAGLFDTLNQGIMSQSFPMIDYPGLAMAQHEMDLADEGLDVQRQAIEDARYAANPFYDQPGLDWIIPTMNSFSFLFPGTGFWNG